MIPNPRRREDITDRGRAWRGRFLAVLSALALSATAWAGSGNGQWEWPFGARAELPAADAPREYRGPLPPLLLAMNDATTASPRAEQLIDTALIRTQGPEAEKPPTAEKENPPRVAAAAGRPRLDGLAHERGASLASAADSSIDAIERAKQAIAACQSRYREVRDYTCMFHKKERIDGQLTQPHIMMMKSRTQPLSLYFKFQRPNKGREAIYVAGRHGGKILAHDVGLGKLVAGTMTLDPKGSMAMDENRHPVTEAGIGSLIDTVARRWAIELTPGESRVSFHENVRVGGHACTMIETVHPQKGPAFLFHMVKLYVDREHGLPIRFEAYDWPKRHGAAPELVEEYTYLNLRTNVGLRDQDFDVANPQYSYGRF